MVFKLELYISIFSDVLPYDIFKEHLRNKEVPPPPFPTFNFFLAAEPLLPQSASPQYISP